MKKTKTGLLVVLSYLCEFALTALLYFLLGALGLLPRVFSFLDRSAGAWSALFGVMLGGALASWLILFTFNSGEFGSWLEWKNLNGVFSGAFLFSVLLFLVTAVVALTESYVKHAWLTKISSCCILLGIINIGSFAILVYNLTKLQARFNLEYRKVKGNPEGSP